MRKTVKMLIALAAAAALPAPALAGGSASVGSGGSAAAGDTSATTLGTAGVSEGDDGSRSASIASGGTAAGPKAKSKTHVNANPYKGNMQAHSKAMSHDKGTFSKSMTKTKAKGEDLTSRTKTMAHVPGQKPVKNTTTAESSIPQ